MPHRGHRSDMIVLPIAGICDRGTECDDKWNRKTWKSLFWQTKVILWTFWYVRESKPGLILSGVCLIQEPVIRGRYAAEKGDFFRSKISGFIITTRKSDQHLTRLNPNDFRAGFERWSIQSPIRARFGNRTILFLVPQEVVSTPTENMVLIGYLRKDAIL